MNDRVQPFFSHILIKQRVTHYDWVRLRNDLFRHKRWGSLKLLAPKVVGLGTRKQSRLFAVAQWLTVHLSLLSLASICARNSFVRFWPSAIC